MTTPLLAVHDLTLDYLNPSRSVRALDRVSFSVNRKETLGLIGESGCGKTSLALALMGLAPNARTLGQIRFKGKDLSELKPADRAALRWRRIALVFQNSQDVFNPVITMGEQVAEALCTHLGLTRSDADRKTCELFDMVGLDPDWARGFAHQLSGGMRQRVLIAMALACSPELLIVDEPFTALDEAARSEMIRLIRALQQDLGFAMILISHSMPAVARLTDQTLTLYAGTVVEQGSTKALLADPLHPYTRGLINACPEFFAYKDLWGIPGAPPVPGQQKGCPFSPRCVQKGPDCTSSRPLLTPAGPGRRVACHNGGIVRLLRAKGLEKRYTLEKKTIRAVQQADLSIKSGEVVALIGPSGSGKSTLAHLLTAVEAPDAGEVCFLGEPVSGRRATSTMGGMQMIFQDPGQAVSPRLKVLEAVREPLDILGWQNKGARDEKAVAALASVFLPTDPEWLCQPCHTLSGGQRQRLSVARALVMDPRLVIADEITAMLDPSAQAALLRLLKGLQHENGFSMLFITHDLSVARKIADRAYVMNQGIITARGAGFEIFAPLENEKRAASQNGTIPKPAAFPPASGVTPTRKESFA